jgi:C1A family cysteine protease
MPEAALRRRAGDFTKAGAAAGKAREHHPMNRKPNAWYGCRRDTKDPRDHMLKPMAIRIPAAVDLRAHCPPVMDQGALGSCTAHGITGALRYEMKRAGRSDVPLSRLQLYFDERTIEGTVASDAGAEIRDGIKSANKRGVGHETLWPYRIKKYRTRPSDAVYADAKRYKALSYQRVEVNASALRQAIAMGHTPIIGVTLFESFEKAVGFTGMVQMPAKGEAVVGGHCLYAVGFGQRPGTFTVRNSWAADWGDHGDCYFPAEYLGSALYGADYWIVTGEGA